MAEEKKEEKIASPEGSHEEKKQEIKEEPAKKEWAELTGGKFKTEDELAKAYKELEHKVGEQGEDIRKSREFAEIINPLLEEIRNDPEIFNKLDERLRKKTQPNAEPDTKAKGEEKIEDVRTVASDILLARFEEKNGINKLSSDERKDIRKLIGDAIFENTGQYLDQVNLKRLSTVLDNAYILAKAKMGDKDKEKLEALISASGTQEGAISGIPSSLGKAEQNLTPEEAKAAERLGLSREQYLKGKSK